jgi:hypothetical protein
MKLMPEKCKRPIIIMMCVGFVIAFGFFYYNYKYAEEITNHDPLNKTLFEIGPVKVSW